MYHLLNKLVWQVLQLTRADTSLDTTSGDNLLINGTISVSSGAAVTSKGTRFNDELKIGDSVSFTNDSGDTLTKIIENYF